MSDPDLTPVVTEAARVLLLHEGADWPENTERHIELAQVVVDAIVPPIIREYTRKRQESVIAATHAAGRWRGEVQRLKHRLDGIERACAPHLNPNTDPCAKGGEAWPCHIATAIESDTSLLQFLAKEGDL